MEKKQVTFSQEAPLVKQYSNDFSAYRKANSQTPREYYLAKKDQKEEEQKRIKEYHDKTEKIADDNRFAYWYLGGKKTKTRRPARPKKHRRTDFFQRPETSVKKSA